MSGLILPPGKSRVYLTGFMGSGKSTVGPLLAQRLGFRFFDLDEQIEARVGKTIAQMFEDEGETFFREAEHEALVGLSKEDHAVISLGGGTLLEFENLLLVRDGGVLICLSATPEELYRRVADSDKRPLLAGPDDNRLSEEEIYRRINRLIARRQSSYDEADLIIDTTGQPAEELVERINLWFQEYCSKAST